MLSFVILGKPIPQPRHQVGNRRAYIPANHRVHPWRAEIRLTLRAAAVACRKNPQVLPDGPAALIAVFVGADRGADIDNLLKPLMDCLQLEGLIGDDRQIQAVSAVKVRKEELQGMNDQPRVQAWLMRWDEVCGFDDLEDIPETCRKAWCTMMWAGNQHDE